MILQFDIGDGHSRGRMSAVGRAAALCCVAGGLLTSHRIAGAVQVSSLSTGTVTLLPTERGSPLVPQDVMILDTNYTC